MTGPGFGQTSLFPPEPAPDPLLCWLWLANTLGAGSSHAGRVLDVFGGAQEAWEDRDSDAFRKAVGSPAFARANLPDNTPAHYRAFARRCAARNIRILPYDDPDYPLAFSRIPDMPLVLYCTGDPLWLNEPGAVGMVGSRRPTEYGLQAAAGPKRSHHRQWSGRWTGQRRAPGCSEGELPHHRGAGRAH